MWQIVKTPPTTFLNLLPRELFAEVRAVSLLADFNNDAPLIILV
jgi:hypothetical protein